MCFCCEEDVVVVFDAFFAEVLADPFAGVDVYGVVCCPGLGFSFCAEALFGARFAVGGAVLDSPCGALCCGVFFD